MHTLSEITNAITEILQFDYNNAVNEPIGIIIGPTDQALQAQIPIKKIAVSLNLSAYTIARAVNQKNDLIISYEPLFYSCIKKIDYTLLRKIRLLAQERAYVFVLGNPLLYAENGINDTLLGLLEIKDTSIIEYKTNASLLESIKRFKVGRLPRETMVREVARDIGKKVGSHHIKIFGSATDFISSIAFVGGALRDKNIVDVLKASGVDAVITGEVDYKIQTYLQDIQLNTIVIGYINSIKPGLKVFKSLLQLKIPKVEVTLLDTDDFLVSEMNIT